MNEAYKNIRVLVVDDEESLRTVVSSSLSRRGFQVEMAESGRAALTKLNGETFDLVISDIRMANGDGLFLLDEMRKKDPHNPKLIFMTGFSDIGVEDCMKRGATGVILKPFGREKLLEAVNGVLGLNKT